MVVKLILFILLFISTVVSPTADAQKVLLLEKKGKIEATRIYIGSEVEIKVKDDPRGWQRVLINDIFIKNESILFDIGTIKLDEIAAIKTTAQLGVPKAVRNKLLLAGASFLLYSPLNLVIDQEYPVWGAVLGVSLIATGFLSEFVLNESLKHKISSRKRLRVVDLSFYGIDPPPPHNRP
jgi:hypothetical protein